MEGRDGGQGAGPRASETAAGELRREVWAWVDGVSPTAAAIVAVGLVALIFMADLLVGPGVSLTLLYLGPVGLCAFYAGLGAGASLGLLATAGALVAAPLAGARLPAPVMTWNAAQQLGVFLVFATVVDAFRKRLLHERHAARTDSLTGAANRRAFEEAGALELERARRNGRPLSLVYLDCDDFKAANERLGHVGGDAVLATVGAALREAVRANDTVARLGGDEFGVLLPEIDGPGAIALTARLRARLREALAARGQGVTFSMGVVTFLAPPATVDDLIARADELMYQVKRAGKDGWRAAVVPAPAGTAVPAPGGVA